MRNKEQQTIDHRETERRWKRVKRVTIDLMEMVIAQDDTLEDWEALLRKLTMFVDVVIRK